MTPADLPEPLPDHLRNLTELERNFVRAWLNGATSATMAARMAGYGGDSKDEKRRTWACVAAAGRLKQRPEIQDAIRKEAAGTLRSGAILGINVLMEIAADPLHKDRFKAGVALMQHNGFIVAQKVEHEHNLGLQKTDGERIERITVLAGLLGIDPRKLLGTIPPHRGNAAGPRDDANQKWIAHSREGVLDAEFTVVAEPASGMAPDGMEW